MPTDPSRSKQPSDSETVKPDQIPGISHIIAVASGKGGVGKSTATLHLALALHRQGFSVGLLDADIYGPSQPTMLGIDDSVRPEIIDGKFFVPIEKYGLHTISMGYLVTDKTPMVWRGPMVSGALMQMLKQTQWPKLDYLLIDMPPGTGDIQLTLAQQIPCTGAVIVTTPQTIAVLDAQKGIEMFKKVSIPCLGIVENMATHICSQCGHADAIFGEGGGESVAEDYGVPFLGRLPLDSAIRAGLDAGEPLRVIEEQGVVAETFNSIAKSLVDSVAGNDVEQAPVINILD